MSIRQIIRSIIFTPYKSSDDLWRTRAKWGEINEFFGMQVVSSDDNGHNLPLLSNPFNSRTQQFNWTIRDEERYDYPDKERADRANVLFGLVYDLLEDRISKDDVIFDVGCNSGYQMDNFHKLGFNNVWGVDPMTAAINLGRKKRPYLNFIDGFFGDPKNDILCDVMVCFGSILRIPYSAKLFNAIDRCAGKYVVMWLQECVDDFNRDPHVAMAKKGFICIEKKVVQDDTCIPIGLEGADGPKLVPGSREHGTPGQRNFWSFFLFRRIEPREPAGVPERRQNA